MHASQVFILLFVEPIPHWPQALQLLTEGIMLFVHQASVEWNQQTAE